MKNVLPHQSTMNFKIKHQTTTVRMENCLPAPEGALCLVTASPKSEQNSTKYASIQQGSGKAEEECYPACHTGTEDLEQVVFLTKQTSISWSRSQILATFFSWNSEYITWGKGQR